MSHFSTCCLSIKRDCEWVLGSSSGPQCGRGLVHSRSASQRNRVVFLRQCGRSLIWEAGIPAVKPTTRGRIFVDQRGKTSTEVAIANVLPFDTVLTLVLRDRFGVEIARIEFPIEGNGQRALFVDQIFEDLPLSFIGSLTFETADESHKGPP